MKNMWIYTEKFHWIFMGFKFHSAFCTLEAMFTTTEENEVALSMFGDFGIFSQDQFCL